MFLRSLTLATFVAAPGARGANVATFTEDAPEGIRGMDAPDVEAEAGEDACTDVANWHDIDGPYYNCDWYALDNNCCYGHMFENDGYTANEACCVCAEKEAEGNNHCDDYYYDYDYDYDYGYYYGSVVCNGQPPENFCDCDYCSLTPEWCACEEAQACCEGALDTSNWSASAEAAKKKHEVAKKKLAQHASVRAAKKEDAERAAVSAHRTKVKSNSGLGKDNSSTAKKIAGPRGDKFTQHARAKAAKGKQFVQRARAKAAMKKNAERAAASAYRAKVKSDSNGRADSGKVAAE